MHVADADVVPEIEPQHTPPPHVVEFEHESDAPAQVAPASMHDEPVAEMQHAWVPTAHEVVPHVAPPPLLLLLAPPPLLEPLLAPPLLLLHALPPDPAGLLDEPPHAIASDVATTAPRHDRA